jgi:hypothetical protein
MKPNLYHFIVELPEAGEGAALVWIGGGLRASRKPGFVWLTTPAGLAVLEVPRARVHPSSPSDLAGRARN